MIKKILENQNDFITFACGYLVKVQPFKFKKYRKIFRDLRKSCPEKLTF